MRQAALTFLALVFGLLSCGGPAPECTDCGNRPAPKAEHRELTTGWDDPPGSGTLFIVDSLAIADFQRGFNLDGKCRGPGDCVDNAVWRLGQLGNDQIRQALLGGESLMLVEIAGIDEPFYGDDKNVTIKVYAARDADDPFFPANNFQIPVGDTKCCEFKVRPESLTPAGQAKTRLPAHIEGYRLQTKGPPRRFVVPSLTLLWLGIFAGSSTDSPELDELIDNSEVPLEQVELFAELDPGLGNISQGLVGGGMALNVLAGIESGMCQEPNQFCPRAMSSISVLDFYASLIQPDLDLDGDGLERVELGSNSRVTRCIDGDGSVVRPLLPEASWTCAIRPEMADGFSTALTFHGVRASVVGVGR